MNRRRIPNGSMTKWNMRQNGGTFCKFIFIDGTCRFSVTNLPITNFPIPKISTNKIPLSKNSYRLAQEGL